jgi:hypothetical protein
LKRGNFKGFTEKAVDVVITKQVDASTTAELAE